MPVVLARRGVDIDRVRGWRLRHPDSRRRLERGYARRSGARGVIETTWGATMRDGAHRLVP